VDEFNLIHSLQYFSHYDVTTDIYLEAWGESFHFCRFPRAPEPKAAAMARYEHYIAHMMGLRPGMRMLDVGCGVGGPAKEIAAFSKCSVVGLNNNGHQVQKAEELSKKDGMEKMVEFVKWDFMVRLSLVAIDMLKLIPLLGYPIPSE
jgi:sterol 24-C-methyltransferase